MRSASDAFPLPSPFAVFNVPTGLLRILNRDLEAAGIPKKDERGRSVDIHAMRHTFGTWLSKGGVAPRTAQTAMRHSDIDLTMQVYTDPKLLDVRGAVESLPQLPLADTTELIKQAATGTDGVQHSRKFAPGFAPESDVQVQTMSIQDKCRDLEDPTQETKKARNQSHIRAISESGRLDSNQRPLRPERSVLAALKCSKAITDNGF